MSRLIIFSILMGFSVSAFSFSQFYESVDAAQLAAECSTYGGCSTINFTAVDQCARVGEPTVAGSADGYFRNGNYYLHCIYGFRTCPNAGETRDSLTGVCTPPPALNCGANEYDNAGVCTPIPDCNADAPLGRNFFDVVTKACKTIEGVGTICIGEYATKYCPPIDDCKPAGYICSNEPNQKAIEDAARASAIAAAAADAAAKKAELEAMAQAAAAAAASKAADAADSKQKVSDAAAELAAAKASGDLAAIAQAIKDYASALDASKDAKARASNSQTASDGVQQANIDGGNEQAQIPSSNPGNAQAHDDNIGDMMPGAEARLRDSLLGDGDGSGRGSGSATTSSPSLDTSGLGKESTLQGIGSKLDGISDKLNGGTTGSFGGMPDSFYTSSYPNGIGGVWDDHKSALMQTSFVSAVHGLTPNIADSGTCPSWSLPELPLMGGYSPELTVTCDIFPLLRVIFIITALFTARSLIFGG